MLLLSLWSGGAWCCCLQSVICLHGLAWPASRNTSPLGVSRPDDCRRTTPWCCCWPPSPLVELRRLLWPIWCFLARSNTYMAQQAYL